MKRFAHLLIGGKLRSIGIINKAVNLVDNQQSFDELFEELKNKDRLVVMRDADAIEKITKEHPEYIQQHKNLILDISKNSKKIEQTWHLALLVTRLEMTNTEFEQVWETLTRWAFN